MNELLPVAKAPATDGKPPTAQRNEDFSLVVGGPLYQLSVRAGLVRPPIELLSRRMVVLAVATWLPLVALTAASGSLLGGVAVPFLFDLDVHVKFLICLPLLIGAELIVHRRVRGVVEQFLERGLIAAEDRTRFDALIARAMGLRNSIVAEVVLLAIAFTVGTWLWRTYVSLHVATWYALPTERSLELTGAGYWYAYVSLPIARFLLLRWYFRLFIWYWFLWRVSRLSLRLNPLHPDRAGGLAFVGSSVDALTPVLIAQTALLAGLIGNQIWHTGATLPQFKFEIAGLIAFLMLLVLTPLAFFVFQLADAKRAGLREYGKLASRYASEFRQKWLRAGEGSGEALLGSADIQSLADLANSYDVVRELRILPFSKSLLLRLAILLALPLLPLTLTMIPFEEMMDRLVKLVL